MKLYVLKTPNQPTIATCQEVADDAPIPASPWELMTVTDFEAWKAMQPAPAQLVPLLRQDTLIVLTRLTDAESQALHSAQASDYRVSKFVLMATSATVIDQANPNYADGVALLDSLGIIAASRWSELLAP